MNSELDIAHLGGLSMGTRWSVKAVIPRQRDTQPLHRAIQQTLDQVVAQMSTWEPDSDISRYQRAPAGSWQTLPAMFAEVLEAALHVAAASGGAFDPTVAPLVALWGFGAQARSPRLPDAAELAACRARCGWQRLQWQPDSRQLLQPGALALDLSGIAKGYGVEAIRRRLQQLQVEAALIDVGGELHGFGLKPDGRCWQVLLESAPEEDADSGLPPRILSLNNLAVATSGDRWHHHQLGGRRVSHTLDPRSGEPVASDVAAVSVVASDATLADAWATALGVLGVSEGLALAEQQHLAVRYLLRGPNGLQEYCSRALQQQLAAA